MLSISNKSNSTLNFQKKHFIKDKANEVRYIITRAFLRNHLNDERYRQVED